MIIDYVYKSLYPSVFQNFDTQSVLLRMTHILLFCPVTAEVAVASGSRVGRSAPVSSLAASRSRSLLPGSYCNINVDEELMAQLGMKLTSGAGCLQVCLSVCVRFSADLCVCLAPSLFLTLHAVLEPGITF